MKSIRAAAAALALVVAAVALPAAALAAPLSYKQLEMMVTDMGFAPKQIAGAKATPKMEIQTKAGTFNVPLGLEISPSGRFIWVTANLGNKALNGTQALEVLKRSMSLQPTQFWYNPSGNLMIGMAIDNRDVTPVYLRYVIEKVGADIVATNDIWGS